MFKNYVYEQPAFIGKKTTDALTAAFAGGGWLHINEGVKTQNRKGLKANSYGTSQTEQGNPA